MIKLGVSSIVRTRGIRVQLREIPCDRRSWLGIKLLAAASQEEGAGRRVDA
jgi:hypothetical protein